MKKASLQDRLRKLRDWIDSYEGIYDSLLNCPIDYLSKEQKIELVEAIAIRLCTIWNFSVEDLLIDCLNWDATQYKLTKHAKGLPKHLSRIECELLLTGTGYFDIKSIRELKKKGRDYLVEAYNPFRAISNKDAKKIDELIVMRNFLAHYSSHSRHKLHKDVYKNSYRQTNFKHPGPFLLAKERTSRRTRMHTYFSAVRSAAHSMADALGVAL